MKRRKNNEDKKTGIFLLKVKVKVMLTVNVKNRYFQILDPFFSSCHPIFLTAIPLPLVPPLLCTCSAAVADLGI